MADARTPDQSGGTRRAVVRALADSARAVSRVLPRAEPEVGGRPPPERSAVVECGLYLDGKRQPDGTDFVRALAAARGHRNGFVWLGLYQPTAEEFADVAATFGLHELAVEDAVRAHQRPKLERYGDVTFVVVKTAGYVGHSELTATTEVVETGHVMVFVGDCFVVTVRHGPACTLGEVRDELESRPDLLVHGPWAVFHAVADHIVDAYLEVADAIGGDIDAVEVSVFGANGTDVQRIYQLKRELLEFKRAVLPLDRPLDGLAGGTVESVPEEIRRYIRDVADHQHRVTDQIAGFDDLVNSILQASLAQIGMQQNNDMRKISAWVAIAAVPTAVAGIYGMNFDHMPELRWRFGYPLVLTVILVVCVFLYRRFKKTGWL